MNCYEVNIDLLVVYERSDGRYPYPDPRCRTWTVRDTLGALVYIWAESADRAREMAIDMGRGQGDRPYDIYGVEVRSIKLCETDDTVTEESIEIESIEEPGHGKS